MGENMIKTIDLLKEDLSEYKNQIDKINRLSKENKIFKLKNGLYETN